MTTDISVGVRWDPLNQTQEGGGGGGGGANNEDYEFDYDGGNSSSRLFERSRIKALAGKELFALKLIYTVKLDPTRSRENYFYIQ